MFTESGMYVPLWSKYRPALLKLMSAAADGPQEYKLYAHELKALNPREKAGYSFDMSVADGKAVKSIKKSTIAQDLLKVLQDSRKASELMTRGTFSFSMDRACVLRVTMEEPPVQEVTDEASAG